MKDDWYEAHALFQLCFFGLIQGSHDLQKAAFRNGVHKQHPYLSWIEIFCLNKIHGGRRRGNTTNLLNLAFNNPAFERCVFFYPTQATANHSRARAIQEHGKEKAESAIFSTVQTDKFKGNGIPRNVNGVFFDDCDLKREQLYEVFSWMQDAVENSFEKQIPFSVIYCG